MRQKRVVKSPVHLILLIHYTGNNTNRSDLD